MKRETIRELLLMIGTVCLILAVAVSIFTLAAACDDRRTVVCRDGTVSTGRHVDAHLCDAHGGVR